MIRETPDRKITDRKILDLAVGSMPVTVYATTQRLSQDDFTSAVYEVMGHVFKYPGFGFNITAVREDALPRIEGHLRRFLAHTPLHGTHWINIRHRLVTFRTLRR